MKKGRLTQEEQKRRIKLLIGFIFIFRYATRKQLDLFVRLNINLKYPQWLIEYTLRQGYIKAYYEPSVRTKIYYLTRKGMDLLYSDEALIEYYRFEKSHAGINTFIHHNLLAEVYFLIKIHLKIREWLCEWVLRIGKKKKEKIPDALLVMADGARIALEVETRYKKLAVLKRFVAMYRYDIEKISRYQAVLIVASSRLHFKGLKMRLFNLAPELCRRRFILSDIVMLEQGMCFYQDKLIHLKEALELLRKEG
jgi:predicted transcriptional regulator